MKRVRLEESLDLIARKVVMTSMIYYGLDESIVPDFLFDRWCYRLHRFWFRLDDFRQWQLGDREAIKSSGQMVKVTQAAANSAVAWLEHKGLLKGQIVASTAWQWSKKRRVHYLPPSNFKMITTRKRIRL